MERSESGQKEVFAPRIGVLAQLRASFDRGGIEALGETHRAASQRISYRFLCWLAELFLPMNALIEIAVQLERRTGEVGAHTACAEVLTRLPNGWTVEFPEQAKEKILGHPALIYGTHGSILTPLLIAAAIDREDAKLIGISWLARLGPNIERCTFPIFTSSPIQLKSAGRAGLAPRLAGWLTSKLENPEERNAAKSHNKESLARAVDHVKRGGAVLISPDPRPPHRKWRKGVGILAASLTNDPPASDCYLVPMRIWNASVTGIFRYLSGNPILKAIGRLQYRRPVRVVFGEPIRLASVVEAVGEDPAQITEHLERRYRELGF